MSYGPPAMVAFTGVRLLTDSHHSRVQGTRNASKTTTRRRFRGRPVHPAGPDYAVPAAELRRTEAGAPRPRAGDAAQARLRLRDLPRLRQARGQEGDHNRR